VAKMMELMLDSIRPSMKRTEAGSDEEGGRNSAIEGTEIRLVVSGAGVGDLVECRRGCEQRGSICRAMSWPE